jgi:hypothetical protein
MNAPQKKTNGAPDFFWKIRSNFAIVSAKTSFSRALPFPPPSGFQVCRQKTSFDLFKSLSRDSANLLGPERASEVHTWTCRTRSLR